MADRPVLSEIAGAVWKILKQPGDLVAAEEPILIVESMKMEFAVVTPAAGILRSIVVQEGAVVAEGDTVATIAT